MHQRYNRLSAHIIDTAAEVSGLRRTNQGYLAMTAIVLTGSFRGTILFSLPFYDISKRFYAD